MPPTQTVDLQEEPAQGAGAADAGAEGPGGPQAPPSGPTGPDVQPDLNKTAPAEPEADSADLPPPIDAPLRPRPPPATTG